MNRTGQSRVDQLAERSLPKPEIRGLIPVISDFLLKNSFFLASFCFFSQDKYSTNTINEKSVDGVLGNRTCGSMMVGADKSTELWRHPLNNSLFTVNFTAKTTINKKRLNLSQ